MSSALIGAGRICDEHIRYLRSSSRARVVGMCDLSPTLARIAANRFDLAQAYTDYKGMIEDTKPDVVHVLTPPTTHERIIRSCLEMDTHVVVEKPIATSRAAFRELWALAESRGMCLIEDHNYRFNRPVLVIDDIVASGRLGEIREVDVRMALSIRAEGGRYADANLPHSSHQMPAGVIHEFLSHLCYLSARYLPTYDRVSAAWSNHGGGTLFRYDDLDAIVIGGPVHARIRFTCHSYPESFTFAVRGSGGTVHTDLFQPYLLLNVPRRGPPQLSPTINQYAAGRALKRAARRNLVNKIMRVSPYEGLHTFLDRSYQALETGSAPPVGWREMDRTLELMDALLDKANWI